MIENILNKMKKELKFSITNQTSISSVERDNINTKTINQDCLVIKIISVERILSNQNKRERVMSRFRVNSLVRWSESKDGFNIKRINKRE
jgi:hypothetical protein